MLFAIKNHWLPSSSLAVVFVVAAISLRSWLQIPWSWELGGREVVVILLATALIAASDGGLHLALGVTLGDAYRTRFQALADFFRPQRGLEIACGSALAAAEELVFRGVLLAVLAARVNVPIALFVSALAFGLLHLIPNRQLGPFAIWAVWEGVLLGLVYVISGSLAVSLIVHAAHDAVGFTVFRWERRDKA